MGVKFQFKTIKARLTFWFLVAALLPLMVVSGIVAYQRVNALKEMAFNGLSAVRDLEVDQVNDWLDERIGDIRTIAEDPEIVAAGWLTGRRGSPGAGKEGLHPAEALLHRYVENYDAYDALFVIDATSGKVIISTDPALIGDSRSGAPYFTEPVRTGRQYIGGIYSSRNLHRPSMVLATPLFPQGRPKEIAGVLAVRIDLENSLFRLLKRRAGMGKTGETFMVNRDLVALSPLRWKRGSPLKTQISDRAAALASRGETGVLETVDYRGKEVLAAYTFIPRTGWGFVAKQDLDEIYAPIRAMLRNILILFLISAAIVYGLASVLARAIARPVKAMAGVSKRIEAGDLSARNPVDRVDELGFLSASFNAMADSIMLQMRIQEGVSDITAAMVRAGGLEDFRKALLAKLVEVTGSSMGAYFLLDRERNTFECFTSIGVSREMLKPFDAAILEGELGQALAYRKICHIRDIPRDTRFTFKTFTGTLLPREIVTIPLIVDNRVVSMISLANIGVYSKESLEIIHRLWTGICTAVSNLRANEETRRLARELRGKNQELEAQSEELRAQAEELQAQSEELQAQSEELQSQNEELEAQRSRSEEASRLKGEFLSNMSHELRTPLNSVMALSRVLIMQAGERLSEEEVGYLEIIQKNGKNLLSLINDILDLSKIEAGRMDLNLKRFSLGSTVVDVMDSLEPIAREKGIAMIREIPDDLPQIESDEARIYQILQNLVGNALKFTDRGSVTVTAGGDVENVRVRVSDTGIGISERDIPHIFEEFRQVDGTSARPYEGTGLGLAIARRAARILGGDITVESVPGEGSSFTLTLPVQCHGKVPRTAPSTLTAPNGKTGARKSILVVDDDPDALNLASQFLSEEGYEVVSTTKGREAVRLARLHRPLAITLDIIMPEMDGWEVLERLKEDPATKRIPVIIVSVTDDRETGLALGAAGYLSKPLTRDLLLREMARVMPVDGNGTGEKKGAGVGEIGRPAGEGAARKVLLVEDNEAAVVQVKKVLEGEGFLVDVAGGGAEALDYLERTVPHGIILDLMMPGMDGFEVLENLRRTKRTARVPVLVLTAKDLTSQEMERLGALGVRDLVQKGDIDREGLLSRVRLMLRGGDRNRKPDTRG